MKTKPQSPEYKAFENLLGQVLRVPKAEIKGRIEEDKREKRTPKSASRVSVSQPSQPRAVFLPPCRSVLRKSVSSPKSAILPARRRASLSS